jgi:hypothetical protein
MFPPTTSKQVIIGKQRCASPLWGACICRTQDGPSRLRNRGERLLLTLVPLACLPVPVSRVVRIAPRLAGLEESGVGLDCGGEREGERWDLDYAKERGIV